MENKDLSSNAIRIEGYKAREAAPIPDSFSSKPS